MSGPVQIQHAHEMDTCVQGRTETHEYHKKGRMGLCTELFPLIVVPSSKQSTVRDGKLYRGSCDQCCCQSYGAVAQSEKQASLAVSELRVPSLDPLVSHHPPRACLPASDGLKRHARVDLHGTDISSQKVLSAGFVHYAALSPTTASPAYIGTEGVDRLDGAQLAFMRLRLAAGAAGGKIFVTTKH